MSPAHELALHLEANGIGDFAGSSGWVINVSREPPKPDTSITLYDTGGFDPLQVDIDFKAPTIQVRVRTRSYPDAYDKHEAIFQLLCIPLERTIGDHHYVGIWRQGEVADIGRDDNDRHLLTANYRINRQLLGDST